MNSNQPSIKHTCIDGQKILFPSQEDWETLRLNAFIDDMPLAILDLLWSALDFTAPSVAIVCQGIQFG